MSSDNPALNLCYLYNQKTQQFQTELLLSEEPWPVSQLSSRAPLLPEPFSAAASVGLLLCPYGPDVLISGGKEKISTSIRG